RSAYLLGAAAACILLPASSGAHNHRHRDVLPFGPLGSRHTSYRVFNTPRRSTAPTATTFAGSGHSSPSPPLLLQAGAEHADDYYSALIAVQTYIDTEWQAHPSEYRVTDAYRTEHTGITHVYLRRTVDGLDIVNDNANFNVDHKGQILSVGKTAPHAGPVKTARHAWPQEVLREWGELQRVTSRAAEATVNRATYAAQEALQRIRHHYGAPGDRQRLFSRWWGALGARPSGSIISPIEAFGALMRKVGSPLTTARMLDEIAIQATLDAGGEPALTLTNVPLSLAVDGRALAKPAFIWLADGQLAPVWDLEVEQRDDWWHAHVDARLGSVHSLVNWVQDASYRVLPLGINDITVGNRTMVLNPEAKLASPLGWHAQSEAATFTTTVGNNVWAQENRNGGWNWRTNYRPSGGRALHFDFPLDLTRDPSEYLDASVSQLFYVTNSLHDLFYRYGFNETAGNFQENNIGRGGREKDGLIANAQDGTYFNNADMATPPDGRRPKMRMFVWTETVPYRDGVFDQGIVIHEYSHGISTRLTGGPMNSGCLPWGESGGMGEGWGDFFATLIRLKPHHSRQSTFTMGEYVTDGGVRKYPYSTDMQVNPSTYQFLDRSAYWGVHAQGEVWAVMLYDMMWNLIDKHGFTSDLFSRNLQYGNTLALQLVIDGLKLQPCLPSFSDARDAILLADVALTGGENQCEIWAAFAKRGLGEDAKVSDDTPWGGGHRTE
ncbi:hypothetical protein EV182_002140, partial [Spiromyces aspiralis]